MRILFSKLKLWWKRQRTLAKAGMIIGVIVILLIALGGKKEEAVIETAVRQDLVRTVAASGTVVSTTDLALSFQKTDLVRSVNVAVGQRVYKGQILATLSNASEAAAVQSARGSLLAAEARYAKAQQGASGEEIRVAEVALANARRTLFSDDLVAEDDAGSATGAPVITGTYNGSSEGQYVIEFDRSINDVRYSGLESGRISVGTNPVPLGTKGLLIAFPATSTRGIGDEWFIKIPNKDGANYTTNLNAYNDALANLELKKNVAPTDLDVARADIESARGSLASAQAEFEKTVIRAPADGTITKVDLKLGELAETFEPVITLQDVGNLYVEASVNESSISNVALGQPVSITYDALGKAMVFASTISSIDLGATVTDNIVNYKVKAVVPDPSLVRSGMTANLSIQTAFAPGVIVVPERVIAEQDGQKTTKLLVDERKGTTRTVAVSTGLRGDGGLVEITAGLSEGDRVVFTAE